MQADMSIDCKPIMPSIISSIMPSMDVNHQMDLKFIELRDINGIFSPRPSLCKFPVNKSSVDKFEGKNPLELKSWVSVVSSAQPSNLKANSTPNNPNIFCYTTYNKYKNKEKTTTSAKWFFFMHNPIMQENNDWNLWEYRLDKKGRITPIGWIQLSENEFKINNTSRFIHTRHNDESWSHEEIIDSTTRISVSLKYLRWILTPSLMRCGLCPDH